MAPADKTNGVVVTEELLQEARDYYDLCERAAALGISTSLDDPATPQTVDALRAAVREAESR